MGGRANKANFGQLEATEIFCSKCRQAMPVRKRLLLVLPEGDKYHYTCSRCGQSLADTVVPRRESLRILLR